MSQQVSGRSALRLVAAGLLVAGSGLLQVSFTSTGAMAATSGTSRLVSTGTSSPSGSAVSPGDVLRNTDAGGDAAGGGGTGPNRSFTTRGGRHTTGTTSSTVDGTSPGLVGGFTGLGITDDAKAAGFVLEPPDQGLCAGNGHVVEMVNVVGQVYNDAGTKEGDTFYLNDFFNEKSPNANASDPSCYYDADTNRFYADMLFYDSDPTTFQLTGTSRIDIAVSDTSDPTGTWSTYSFDVTKDGSTATNLGDYPQIGADAQGLYITTNSYPIFADGFGGGQLYAMSKVGLADKTDTRVTNVPLGKNQGATAFGLRPTTAPGSGYDSANHGTELLTSSQATQEAGNKQGFDQAIDLWALQHTDTLAPNKSRALTLTSNAVTVDRYGVPPLSDQKAGPYPLGQCLGSQPCRADVFGSTANPAPTHVEGQLDSSDSRMNQSIYNQGLVYATLDTVVNVGGQDRAGLAYYVLKPSATAGGVMKTSVVKQGTLALANNNLIYGAFGVTPAGTAVLALNVVGKEYYPSTGYVTFDSSLNPSPIHIAGAGAAPTDGFTEYTDFTGTLRPRWGDYAATAFDPSTGSIWIANEYVATTCNLATYQTDQTCGGTRSKYGNWSTYVAQVKP